MYFNNIEKKYFSNLKFVVEFFFFAMLKEEGTYITYKSALRAHIDNYVVGRRQL